MEKEAEIARQIRTNCKTRLTKFNTFLEKCLKEQPIITSVEGIQLRTDKIKETWSEFEKAQLSLEVLAPGPTREIDRNEFENNYFNYVAKASKLIKERIPHVSVAEDNELTRQRSRIVELEAELISQREAELMHLRTLASSRSVNTESEVAIPKLHYPLPKLDLPTFSGGYEHWLGFKDLFIAIIHSDVNIPNVQKLRYLKSYLRDSAARIIENIETSDANYDVAWGLLEERYDNKRIIIQNHMKGLLELSIPNKDSAADLRDLLDAILRHLRALRSLGQPTESWDTPLICFISSKLDRESRREWERSIKGSDMPVFQDLLDFLRERCQILETLNPVTCGQGKQSVKPSYKGQINIEKKIPGKSFVNTQSKFTCIICQENHLIYNCPEFEKLSVNERVQVVKRKGLCFNCLRGNHLVNECKSRTCNVCHRRHNSMLHPEDIMQSSANTGIENANNNKGKSLHATDASAVLLSTAMVNIMNINGERVNCRILLDSGSQPNIMTERFAKLLNLKRRRLSSAIELLNNSEVNGADWVETELESKTCNYCISVSFVVLPTITGHIPSIPINKDKLKIPSHLKLADPEFYRPSNIDVLIGGEFYHDILGHVKIPLALPNTTLVNSRIGWIVAGKINNDSYQQKLKCNLVVDTLRDQLDKFWRIEEGTPIKYFTNEEIRCEKHFVENIHRDLMGRYIVSMPFNGREKELGSSYEVSKRRYFALERKLAKNSELKQNYNKFMQEYEQLGHMELSSSRPDEGYYLPHQAVLKETSLTTKLRVVFDASARTNTGISLNETLLIGPTIQDGIVKLLLRFRQHPVALSADIEKMYRQFWIHPSDRKYQKILWRYNETGPVKTYELRTVTYGTSSAPFLAIRCLKQLSIDEGHQYPLAAKVLRDDFYVDDLLTGTETVEEAQQLKEELIKLTEKAGLRLCKWRSNKLETLQGREFTETALKIDEDQSSRTLGIMWDSKRDNLCFDVNPDLDQEVTSKRIMLSQIAKLYDPLGLLAPITVFGKIKLQELWKLKTTWDDPVPPKILMEYEQYRNQLIELNDWKIERAIMTEGARNLQIHGFADASQKAYGACIYIRTTNKEKHHTVLLCSRSRVAPIRTVSLPRLELCAAVLLSNLLTQVKESIRCKVEQVHLWSDSTIVLNWIKSSPHEFGTFVANRIAEIQKLTQVESWRHVISQENPADFISRGQMPRELLTNELWKMGPHWLRGMETQWPTSQSKQVELPERKRNIVLTVRTKENGLNIWTRFSSLATLIHVVAYCLRFISRIRKLNQNSGQLSTSEIQEAFDRVVSLVQREEFADEIQELSKSRLLPRKSKLTRLNPIIVDGLLRVGGRIKRAELSYDQQHPILIPKCHPFTEMLIRDIHEKQLHAGINGTLYALRLRFWPIDGRLGVRGVIHKCIKCCRVKPEEPSYVMGNLPKARVTPSRVFENTGVDYCGPFFIKEKKFRNKNKIKVYAAVFVCLSTKALHIEVVSDLSTEAFLACLRRFFARRGKSRALYSDNGTNFVGARNELSELHSLLESEKHNEIVYRKLADQNIEWHFSPPRTPHFGGIWEAAVKSLKHHLRRTMGETLCTYEEICTYMCEIEAVLNSRPLTPMSADPNDLRALTPGHFLIGEALTTIPSLDHSRTPINRLSRWQHMQKMKRDFWQRWSHEYLNELNVRSKWHTGSPEIIKEGTLVVMRDENLPPLKWSLGRVIQIRPGDDGIVRVVRVKTQSGEYDRGVKKISPLPIDA